MNNSRLLAVALLVVAGFMIYRDARATVATAVVKREADKRAALGLVN